ncbi:HlyD family type I secretion periplasmic adaptor subunit [Pseudoalteromonas ruthenica]|uniref:HlyD family type I secretion periplasmic adaptor subunit n=1 Tax=Pseudoalteromonas ruthenica TaxID=151081 RepID=UPI00110AC8F6|nr:HlyD family type I secretion periplasmic adaptor subunit [Pseudoalteromonas ruthenica]TMO46964.1 HlyD family type I secretion periplasmic adaptor subunit [Pseudoalteromonas ruthenica]TMO52911.1 HlyD family type I secretion periplasmic adaptor subunit [Pseudoalteromonas ruthenica]
MFKKQFCLYEFLPAALEVQSAPPPRLARSIVWSLVILFIIAILWACLGTVNIVAIAPGKITPKQQVKAIQPMEKGVVSAIHIVEGQRVEKGQMLIELDPAMSAADSRNLLKQKENLGGNIQRLMMFVAFQEYGLEPDYSAIDEKQQAILKNEVTVYLENTKVMKAEIERLKAEFQAAKLEERKVRLTLPLIQERAQSMAELERKKMIAREQFLALKQEAIELEQQLSIEETNILRLQAALAIAQSNLIQQRSEQLNKTLLHLNDLETQLFQVSQELEKSRFVEKKTRLLSPVAGTVESLAVTTLGGVVTPGQELLRVVPENDELIIEAGLLNKDIGFAYPGQEVEIKVESFPFTRYGIIKGEVTSVSKDATEHEQLGLVFPIKISLKKNSIEVDNRLVPLSSGMAVSAEIKTGSRRIIEFLLSPIMQHVQEGARER